MTITGTAFSPDFSAGEFAAAAATAYPTRDELITKLANYVDVDMGSSSADPEFVEDCADEAIEWLTQTIGAVPVPVHAYTRSFLEGGAQLFRRRRTWGNIDPLEVPAVPPVYGNPFRPAFIIIEPYLPPAIA